MSRPVPENVPEAVPSAEAIEEAKRKLSAKDVKAIREAARREVKAEEKARIEAELREKTGGAAKPAAPAAAPGAAAAPAAAPERKPEDSARDCAVFLRGVLFPLLALVARPFGYRLDLAAFTEAQAAEDAKAWVPLLRLYPTLDRVVAWVSAPARVVARVRELARPREKEPTP